MNVLKAARIAAVAAITGGTALYGVGSASAAASSFATGFQVVNLSSATANVTISFYQEGQGSAAFSLTDTITPKGNKTYSSLASISGFPSSFSGSAAISADQKVAALVNVIGDGNFFNGASYSGLSQGSKSVSLPLLFKNASNFNSFFNVQNTGSTTANVTVTYSNGQEDKFSLPANSAKRLDQSSSTKLSDGFVGSAVVTSDQDVAAAAIQNGPTTILSYNGFNSGSTAPVMPLINQNNSGFFTGISLQNTGSSSTNVTVTYTPSTNGTACTETQTIAAKSTGIFALGVFGNGSVPSGTTSNCTKGSLFVGSAKVTTNSASQPLVAVVNQLNQKTNKGGAYNSADASSATNTVVFPIIQDRLAGYFTGFSLVNVGDAAVSISCSYSGTSYTDSVSSLAVGATFTTNQNNKIAASYNGSGVCTATGGSAPKIVGVLNQVNLSKTTDSFFVSNGINN